MPSDSRSSNARFLLNAGTERRKSVLEGLELMDATPAEYTRDRLRSRLIEDHSRMKKTLEEVVWLVQQGSLVTAAKRFGEFRIAQERGMNLEESALFPIFERLSAPNEAIRQGRAHHEEIRRLLNAISASLSTSRVHEFARAYGQLRAVFLEHCEFEERLLTLGLTSAGTETVEEIQSAMRRF